METQCLLESAFMIENFDGTFYYQLCKKGKKKKKIPDLADSSDAPSTNGEVGQKTGSQQGNAYRPVWALGSLPTAPVGDLSSCRSDAGLDYAPSTGSSPSLKETGPWPLSLPYDMN